MMVPVALVLITYGLICKNLEVLERLKIFIYSACILFLVMSVVIEKRKWAKIVYLVPCAILIYPAVTILLLWFNEH